MSRIQDSIEVNAPVEKCYEIYSNFERFPEFMKNVDSVRALGNGLWKWKIKGPLGIDAEFDAGIHGMEPNQVISWQSTPDSKVRVTGAVRFEDLGASRTRLTVTNEYDPPAGALGDAVAQIFANPEAMMKEDLENFKRLAEQGGVTTSAVSQQTSEYGYESNQTFGTQQPTGSYGNIGGTSEVTGAGYGGGMASGSGMLVEGYEYEESGYEDIGTSSGDAGSYGDMNTGTDLGNIGTDVTGREVAGDISSGTASTLKGTGGDYRDVTGGEEYLDDDSSYMEPKGNPKI